MNRLFTILALILGLLYSCGPSKRTKLEYENYRLYKENASLMEASRNRVIDCKPTASTSKIVKGIRGVIIAKSVTKVTRIYSFYIRLENSKEIKWITTEEKYNSKNVGSLVYFDYIGKYRFQDKLL